MHGFLRRARWSPYVVGVMIGVLSWITFAAMGKALGVSTSFVQVAGVGEALVAPEHVKATPYFMKYLDGKPAFEWQLALVLMLAVGAFISVRLSGDRRVERVPSIWRDRFGSSRALRYAGAFVGGVLLLYGARLAGGCTSGHAISGGLQLAVGSWTFLMSMFIAGVVAAFAIYGTGSRKAGG